MNKETPEFNQPRLATILRALRRIEEPPADIDKKEILAATEKFSETKEISKQIAKTILGTAASIIGVKSFYDVPEYVRERFMVRGMFGKGKGVEGSIEELLSARQSLGFDLNMRQIKGEQVEPAPALEKDKDVKQAIADLNKRLKLTREGGQKGSEQRKMIAQLLGENRVREKISKEERKLKISEVLNEYTTTKISGIEAAREGLNTFLVASGAYGLRGVSYGIMDAFARCQKLNKEAKRKGEKVGVLKDIVLGGLKETWDEMRLKDEGGKKTGLQKTLTGIRAWGKVARYVGIGAMMHWHPETAGNSLDKALEMFEGKAKLSDVANSFKGNIEKLYEFYGSAIKKAVGAGGVPTPGIIVPGAKMEQIPPAKMEQVLPASPKAPEIAEKIISGNVEQGSSIEGEIIKRLTGQGMDKQAAGSEAHRLVLDYAQRKGVDWEEFNRVKPGTKIDLPWDKDEGKWRLREIEEKGIIRKTAEQLEREVEAGEKGAGDQAESEEFYKKLDEEEKQEIEERELSRKISEAGGAKATGAEVGGEESALDKSQREYKESTDKVEEIKEPVATGRDIDLSKEQEKLADIISSDKTYGNKIIDLARGIDSGKLQTGELIDYYQKKTGESLSPESVENIKNNFKTIAEAIKKGVIGENQKSLNEEEYITALAKIIATRDFSAVKRFEAMKALEVFLRKLGQ